MQDLGIPIDKTEFLKNIIKSKINELKKKGKVLRVLHPYIYGVFLSKREIFLIAFDFYFPSRKRAFLKKIAEKYSLEVIIFNERGRYEILRPEARKTITFKCKICGERNRFYLTSPLICRKCGKEYNFICFNCGKEFQAKDSEICLKCGWLICPVCGFCGCSFKKEFTEWKKAKRKASLPQKRRMQFLGFVTVGIDEQNL